MNGLLMVLSTLNGKMKTTTMRLFTKMSMVMSWLSREMKMVRSWTPGNNKKIQKGVNKTPFVFRRITSKSSKNSSCFFRKYMVLYWCQGEGTLPRVGQLSGVANCWNKGTV